MNGKSHDQDLKNTQRSPGRQKHRERHRGKETDAERRQAARFKTKVPFVPPKPKELEIAISIFIWRASLAQ